jgi:hypothetical protein
LQILRKYWSPAIAIILILIAFALVYQPTLFNFLVADDFTYMVWLKNVLQHPETILKIFWCSNVEIPPPAMHMFYRPLFPAMLFLESKLWGFNSVYFRLINLVTELFCGLTLGLVVISLSKKSFEESPLLNQQAFIWGLFSTLLFIFFPLHSESANWIAARMDLLVTLFILLSL